MDVQNVVSELEELLGILGEYRRNWIEAETERDKSIISPERDEPTAKSQRSSKSLPQKRNASSRT